MINVWYQYKNRWESTGLWLMVEVNCLFASVAQACSDYCYPEWMKIHQAGPWRLVLLAEGAYGNIFKWMLLEVQWYFYMEDIIPEAVRKVTREEMWSFQVLEKRCWASSDLQTQSNGVMKMKTGSLNVFCLPWMIWNVLKSCKYDVNMMYIYWIDICVSDIIHF